MQTCPNCGETSLDGVLFCEDCGEALTPSRLAALRNQLVLAVGEERRLVELEVQGHVVLGRAHDTSSLLLSLDSREAHALGVSRSHAALSFQNGDLYIRDLESSNHTYLNGERLLPNRSYRLRNF